MCFDLKPVICISIIFHVKLLECGGKDGRKGQENKTDSLARKLLVNGFPLKGGKMVIFAYCTYIYNEVERNPICTFIFNFVQYALSFPG